MSRAKMKNLLLRKTLTMSMAEQFFSIEYADSPCLRGMDIWKEEK